MLAMVVSHTTTRFDGPKPATYAFTALSLVLASISNMRASGISSPPRFTTCEMDCTRCGCWSFRGVNLKNSGSISTGAMNCRKMTIGIATSQK